MFSVSVSGFSSLLSLAPSCLFFFFFNDTATTEIYTLSLHDALPIWSWRPTRASPPRTSGGATGRPSATSSASGSAASHRWKRSEEHTSELQSPDHLVCRLLLEKKKKKNTKDPLSCIRNTTAIRTTPY